MDNHIFTVKGTWEGNRLGLGKIKGNDWESVVSTPKQLDGPGTGANPDELLIAAAANCYLIALASILSNRKIEYIKLEITSEGLITQKGNHLHFEKIVHKPIVYVENLEAEKSIKQLAERAEKACFISQTLRGNVEVSVEPSVRIIKQ